MFSITAGAFIGLFLYGLIFTVTGPALPFLMEDFGFSLAEAGSLYALRGVGMIAAVVASGLFADILGYRRIVMAGTSLQVAGLVVFSFTTSPWLALASWLVVGLGMGTLGTTLNALVAMANTEKGAALNRLHFWFGVGALVGPFTAGVLLSHFPWRILFYLTSLLAIAYFWYMHRLEYPASPPGASSPWANLGHILHLPVLLLAVVVAGYTGVGSSILGWLNTYAVGELGMTTFAASLILTLYSVGIASGRLAASFAAERVGYERLLAFCAVLSMGMAAITVLSTHPIWMGAGALMTGFFFASLLPTSLAIAIRRFPELTGTVTGVLITFGSIARTIVPGLVGIIGDLSSLTVALRSLLLILAAMVVAALLTAARRSQQPSR